MINRIVSDESLQVLLFVCLPLFMLLLAALIVRRRLSRSIVSFPDFSVAVSSVGRYETYVIYRDSIRQLEFNADIRRGRRLFIPEILVQIPTNMPEQDRSVIVPNLVRGLQSLHYQYLVYQKGEPQVIPEQERDAAITELRQMGVEIQTSIQGQVQRAVVGDWQNTVGKRANIVMPRLMTLMNTAKGIRESIEILARSEVRK
jgi:hypothetical protein